MEKNNYWHLIYTRPKQEKKIATQLQHSNIEYFLPMIKSIRQWHDRKKIIEMPLFPSYVFVNLANSQDYFKSSELDGFVKYVRLGKDIAKVEDKVISAIKIAVSHFSKIELETAHFSPGQNLSIKDGPLSGFQCEMIHYKGKRKALVRITHIGQNLLVDIPTSLLEASNYKVLGNRN